MDLFDQLTRGYIGSDRFMTLQAQLAANAKKFGSFPFYNIKKTGDSKYSVELCVAGFSKENLCVSFEKQKLTIKGELPDKEDSYIFRGISSKKFTREFTLASGVKTVGASLKDGILTVELEYHNEDFSTKIEIIEKSADKQILNG